MLRLFLYLKPTIQAIQATQTNDKSLKCLNLSNNDWDTLEEIQKFFEVFKEATICMQADKYPTLHQTVPFYVHLMRELKTFTTNKSQPLL